MVVHRRTNSTGVSASVLESRGRGYNEFSRIFDKDLNPENIHSMRYCQEAIKGLSIFLNKGSFSYDDGPNFSEHNLKRKVLYRLEPVTLSMSPGSDSVIKRVITDKIKSLKVRLNHLMISITNTRSAGETAILPDKMTQEVYRDNLNYLSEMNLSSTGDSIIPVTIAGVMAFSTWAVVHGILFLKDCFYI